MFVKGGRNGHLFFDVKSVERILIVRRGGSGARTKTGAAPPHSSEWVCPVVSGYYTYRWLG